MIYQSPSRIITRCVEPPPPPPPPVFEYYLRMDGVNDSISITPFNFALPYATPFTMFLKLYSGQTLINWNATSGFQLVPNAMVVRGGGSKTWTFASSSGFLNGAGVTQISYSGAGLTKADFIITVNGVVLTPLGADPVVTKVTLPSGPSYLGQTTPVFAYRAGVIMEYSVANYSKTLLEMQADYAAGTQTVDSRGWYRPPLIPRYPDYITTLNVANINSGAAPWNDSLGTYRYAINGKTTPLSLTTDFVEIEL